MLLYQKVIIFVRYISKNMTDNTSLLHTKIKRQLRQWAKQYNTKDFILSDPIQFPHRYSQIKDIEISAFLTAWISYGNRKIIIAKGHELDQMFNGSPYNFLIERKFQPLKNNKSSFIVFSNMKIYIKYVTDYINVIYNMNPYKMP